MPLQPPKLAKNFMLLAGFLSWTASRDPRQRYIPNQLEDTRFELC
jgi:hypothetical protein